MTDNKAANRSTLEKKGGYTGGGSAATARPPVRVPSGAYCPSPKDGSKRQDPKKQ